MPERERMGLVKNLPVKNVLKIMWRRMARTVVFMSGGALLGLSALVLVYCLPVAAIAENVRQSMPMLEREFADGEVIPGYPASVAGNFTDYVMLGSAVYRAEGHSRLEQALRVYRAESGSEDAWMPGYSLQDYLDGAAGQLELEYSRYWHGYLVILKPLLCFLPLRSIRLGNAIAQLLLVGGILILCMRRGKTGLAVSFLISAPFWYFFTLYQSLSLSICFYIMAFSLLIQLKCHEKLDQGDHYSDFFLLAGMATAYFDFLTWPLVTLGFPLCVYLYLKETPVREKLRRAAAFCAEWGVGYGGFWALKWVIADTLCQGGNLSTLSSAGGALTERTDVVEGVGLFGVIWKNIAAYRNHAFVLFGAGLLLWCVYRARRGGRSFLPWKNLDYSILLVGLLPFAWFALTQNHSYEHAAFTCKILSVTVFSLCSAIGKGGEKRYGEGAAEKRIFCQGWADCGEGTSGKDSGA